MLKVWRDTKTNAFIMAAASKDAGTAAEIGCDSSAEVLRDAALRNAIGYGEALASENKARWSTYQAWGPDDFSRDMVRITAFLPTLRAELWRQAACRQCGDKIRIDLCDDALFDIGLRATAVAYDAQDPTRQLRLPEHGSKSLYSNVSENSPLLRAAALLHHFGGHASVTRAVRWQDLCFSDRVESVLENRSAHDAFDKVRQEVDRAMQWECRADPTVLPDIVLPWNPVML